MNSDADERQDIFCHHDLGFAEDRITERYIDAKGLTVLLAGEFALRSEAEPVALRTLVPDLGVVVVVADLEGHEVGKVVASSLLQSGEDA